MADNIDLSLKIRVLSSLLVPPGGDRAGRRSSSSGWSVNRPMVESMYLPFSNSETWCNCQCHLSFPPIFVAFISPLSGSVISTLIKCCCIFQTIARHLLHQHQSTHSRLCMRGARQPQYSDRYLLPHIFSLLILTIDFEKYCWLLSADFFAPCHPYISYLVTALEWYPMQFGYPPMFKARHN